MRSEAEIMAEIKSRSERIRELQLNEHPEFNNKFVVIHMHEDKRDALKWVLSNGK